MTQYEEVIEIFEDYGFIETEDASSGEYTSEEEQNMLDIYHENLVDYISTGRSFNGWPIFKIQGPRSKVRAMYKEYWQPDDDEMVDETMEFFEVIK